MKIPFSQRYGYVTVEKVIIRESLTGSVLNSTYNFLNDTIQDNRLDDSMELHKELWYKVLNFRYGQHGPKIIDLIIDEDIPWYIRIDYLEWYIGFLRSTVNKPSYSEAYRKECNQALDSYIKWLNSEYDRHNYGYRIIDDVFIETTSAPELATIQEAINEVDANVVTHLQECLRLLSPSNQELSTRNAIKEAISAVEVMARQITNTNTLDNAFKKLTCIHPMIKNSMEMLYHYTNQKDTGIRHGWMKQSEEPSINEAIFVLVTSCSFINYLNKVYLNSSL